MAGAGAVPGGGGDIFCENILGCFSEPPRIVLVAFSDPEIPKNFLKEKTIFRAAAREKGDFLGVFGQLFGPKGCPCEILQGGGLLGYIRTGVPQWTPQKSPK